MTRGDLIRRLEERGRVGSDLSPGDDLCAEAARVLRDPRKKLPNRRHATTLRFEHATGAYTHKYLLTVGVYPDDGGVGELFLNMDMSAGSESDTNAADAAVAVSLALQYGCPLEELRVAMKRNADGSPTGPLAKALDVVSEYVKS
jgi:hypothetical protein